MKTLKQLFLLLVTAAIFEACNEDESIKDGQIDLYSRLNLIPKVQFLFYPMVRS